MKALASPKLTLVALALLAAGVAGSYVAPEPAWWAIAAPLLLLAGNLAGAIACHPAFRRQTALLVFHVALATLALLAAAGQLMSLSGRVELTAGEAFTGELLERTQGPLHRDRLGDVWFVNEALEIDYAPGLRRGETRNAVRWRDDSGRERVAVIGDQTPLVVHGYRFATTPNKGFAPIFTWQPRGGGPMLASVHLPSYPAWRALQAADWTPPGSAARLNLSLHLDGAAAEDDRWQLRVPERYRLEMEVDGVRRVLEPGSVVELGAGRLRFERLATWMGYQVFYDWTLPWLLAAAALAAAALAWHFAARFLARPWLEAA